MKKFIIVLLSLSLMLVLMASAQKTKNPYYSRTNKTKLHISNKEWKKILEPNLYAVAREGATEKAFTGKYNEFDNKGTYYCAVCGSN